jgi:hypothetical protein
MTSRGDGPRDRVTLYNFTDDDIVAEDNSFPALPRQENEEVFTSRVDALVSQLQRLSPEDLIADLDKVRDKIRQKQGLDLSRVKDLVPGLSSKEKYILLPKRDKEDHPNKCLYASMAEVALNLGYRVYELPDYGGKLRDVTDENQKLSDGISFLVFDLENHFNMSQKTDPYERGRTFARSQQIKNVFETTDWLGSNALKRNQRFFGNNKDEEETIGKSKVKVRYMGRDLEDIFEEKDWSAQLAGLITSLCKKSSALLGEKIRDFEIKKNVLTKSECVLLFQSRETVIGEKRSRVLKKTVVPHKPRSSNLLLKEEYNLLSEIIDPLFNDNIPSDVDDWLSYLRRIGFDQMVKEMRRLSSRRTEFLQKFSSMTTRRLNAIREFNPERFKSKRKKDIDAGDVRSFLTNRNNQAESFAYEILALDPQFDQFLGRFTVKDAKGHTSRWDSIANIVNEINRAVPYLPVTKESEDRSFTKVRSKDKGKVSIMSDIIADTIKKGDEIRRKDEDEPPDKHAQQPGRPWWKDMINNAKASLTIGSQDEKAYTSILSSISESEYKKYFGNVRDIPDITELSRRFPAKVGTASVVKRL